MTFLVGTEEYVIDSSSLIEGLKKTYPIEVFPSLWDKLAEQISLGKVIAPDEVKKELDEFGVDELAKWCNEFPHFFQPEDAEVQVEVSAIMAHPEHCKLLNVKSPSRYCADVWVIALAKIRRLIVINEEKIMNPDPNSKKNKIPNVCKDLGIDYMTFLEYVRLQTWKF